MQKVILGKTGIEVSKNGFGALPIQRISKKDAVYLLQKAFYNGINYFDTARAYSDSEEKIGAAFEYTRDKIIISTKTMAATGRELEQDLEQLKTYRGRIERLRVELQALLRETEQKAEALEQKVETVTMAVPEANLSLFQ